MAISVNSASSGVSGARRVRKPQGLPWSSSIMGGEGGQRGWRLSRAAHGRSDAFVTAVTSSKVSSGAACSRRMLVERRRWQGPSVARNADTDLHADRPRSTGTARRVTVCMDVVPRCCLCLDEARVHLARRLLRAAGRSASFPRARGGCGQRPGAKRERQDDGSQRMAYGFPLFVPGQSAHGSGVEKEEVGRVRPLLQPWLGQLSPLSKV
jgi:hypothetical protein